MGVRCQVSGVKCQDLLGAAAVVPAPRFHGDMLRGNDELRGWFDRLAANGFRFCWDVMGEGWFDMLTTNGVGFAGTRD